MKLVSKKEKELLRHFDAIFSRYSISTERNNVERKSIDVCRKPELKIVDVLGKNGPMIMTDVAEHARLSLSTLTSIMDSLVEKVLVKRERSEEDRRIVRVQLTREGRLVYQEILEFQLRIVRGMLNNLNKQEQEQLIGLFRKIVENTEKQKRPKIV